MTEAETAWAAGLFEGEGSIISREETKGTFRRGHLIVQLGMKDEDVVHRFGEAVGAGRVHSWEQRGTRMWTWRASGDDAAKILTALLPHFGERRKDKAVYALAGHAEWKRTQHPTVARMRA